MAKLRIPKNKIKTGLYTSGGEFLIAKTQQRYQGYYYELNGKFYAGEEYRENSFELIRATSDKINKLLTNPFTNLYGTLSGVILSNIQPKAIQFNQDNPRNVFRYFTKKTNENVIREIEEDNFNQIQNNPIYISLSLFFSDYGFNQNELDEAEKKMTGIKEYINTTYVPGVTD